jgi:hypothetical protein
MLCSYGVRLADLSASNCKKALCCNLTRGRRIWRGARRSPVLCGVGFWCFVHVRRLKEANKDDEELVDVAPGWG